MTDNNSNEKAAELLNRAIEQFQKVDGTVEERLELVEALVADLAKSVGKLGLSQGELSKSLLLLLAGIERLGARVKRLEDLISQSLITPPTSFSPKDAN